MNTENSMEIPEKKVFFVDASCSLSKARAGRVRTAHGNIMTPAFMPVGTQATVKSQTAESLRTSGSTTLLANTYHLMLRPGIEVFRKFGGIHSFMKWDGPVLTDSGGFQIFSLGHDVKLVEEGAFFKSYVTGAQILVSPETSVGMQQALRSDIMMVLDQCVSSVADEKTVFEAMERTHRWAIRSLEAKLKSDSVEEGRSKQLLFSIVQGACRPELRRMSASYLTQYPFDGFAIGGLAVGESKSIREDLTDLTTDFLPREAPRYLMGVGTPIDILEGVKRGVDLFDCILPTLLGQRGVAFTRMGKVQLRRGRYKFIEEPLDPDCSCLTCQTYSKAYLHHLIKSSEVLGWHLLSFHNLTFYQEMMAEIRRCLLEGSFPAYYEMNRGRFAQSDGGGD